MLYAYTQYLSIGGESRCRNVDVDAPDERKEWGEIDDILYRIEARDHNHTCSVLRVELGVVQK